MSTVIYADPPWRFRGGFYCKPGAESNLPYSSMSAKEIKALSPGVRKIAGDSSVLFLWTTDKHLSQALLTIKAWGFKYKTIGFVWLKMTKKGEPVHRTSYYTRKSTELCLLATRGPVHSKWLKKHSDQLVQEACREHSRKPDTVRDRIAEMFSESQKYELFARHKFDGWKSWGNEIEKDFEMETKPPGVFRQPKRKEEHEAPVAKKPRKA